MKKEKLEASAPHPPKRLQRTDTCSRDCMPENRDILIN